MNIDDLRNLTKKVCRYRLDNNLSYAEFCGLADISHNDLVALQVGNYAALPADVIKKVGVIVYE